MTVDGQFQMFDELDPVLAGLRRRIGPYALCRTPDPWQALAEAVIFQQIAGKAAAKLVARARHVFGGFPTPLEVVESWDAPEGDPRREKIRTCGLPRRKQETIVDLARAIVEGKLDLGELAEKDESVLQHVLGKVKGVGPWTVQMWMVFHLGRLDVFMPGDLGLRKAIAHHYGMPAPPSPREALAFAERWRPYRTVASWYLWKSLPGFPEPGFGGHTAASE